MQYISTRDKNNKCSASEAIVSGLAIDGGLFVPEEFPNITFDELNNMKGQSYEERSAYVLSKFLTDFTYEELLGYTEKAYAKFYGDPCPLVALNADTYMLELWHGPTAAFKDMALTLLPYLLTASREKTGENSKTLILVATSGDTGKAALEGFKDVEGTEIIVFYPSEGVSDMQKMQMQTQDGDNVYACAIEGNFDDAQNAVKSIFADASMKKQLKDCGYKLSSANSINWGRLAPQIAYYVSAYVDLLDSDCIADGAPINFVVPSGNFGNILAGYYAKRLGLPINKLVCASNVNNVLTDFFVCGEYNINRQFYKTMSPSMDILISSNLERLLFEIMGRDDHAVVEMMDSLKKDGVYNIELEKLKKAMPEFMAGSSDEESTADTLYGFYEEFDYVLDPHTGVAADVYSQLLAKNELNEPTIIVSTASPYKFPSDVYFALESERVDDAIIASKKLFNITGEEIPEPLLGLKGKSIRFKDLIAKEDIKAKVLEVFKK